MEKKSISTGKKLFIILLFSISAIFFGILLSFFIKFLYFGITTNNNDALDESLMGLVFSLIPGIIFYKTLMILLRDYDRNKKEKNKKWYVDKFLLALIPVWITIALVVFSFYFYDEEVVFLIFPFALFICIGISATPNVVLYALNDMKNWKNIFYKKGNLGSRKMTGDFYRMHAPVSFERKIYFAVLREQILNITTVILVVIAFLGMKLISVSLEGTGVSGNLFYAIAHAAAVRAEGYLFFGSVFIVTFWIPIFAYYITNAVYKLRIVRRHEYIVYHAVVDKVDTFKLRINNSGFRYEYNYCSCVGIKAKNINKTNAILIFVPDDLLLFPDEEMKNTFK